MKKKNACPPACKCKCKESIISLCLCLSACWSLLGPLALQISCPPGPRLQSQAVVAPFPAAEQGGHKAMKEMVSSREACHCHLPRAEGLWQLTLIQVDARQEKLPSALGDLVSPVINRQSWNQTSSWLNSDVPGSLSLPNKSSWSWTAA